MTDGGTLHLPPVGLGTMGISDPATVKLALARGYRHLDTAQIYDNERVVGDGFSEARADPTVDCSREDVIVATKLWVDALTAEDVASNARTSAEKLGVERLDLLYVHRPRGAYDPTETLPAFARLVEKGLVGHVGVSNFEIDQLDRAIQVLGGEGVPLAAHQTELHPLFYQSDLLEHAREHGYTVVAYSPLAGGRVGEIDVVRDVAAKHNTTPEAVSLAWVLSKEPVVTIPKASSPAHLEANLAAAEVVLDEADVARIDAIEAAEELYPE